MKLQHLFEEAEVKLLLGWSESRIVDFVYQNANNDKQAKKILTKILGA